MWSFLCKNNWTWQDASDLRYILRCLYIADPVTAQSIHTQLKKSRRLRANMLKHARDLLVFKMYKAGKKELKNVY